MIYIDFENGSAERLKSFFEQSPARIEKSVEAAMLRVMADLKTYIQTEKLQGQVLNSHKNGAGLAGSLNVRVTNEGGLAISGSVGTILSYARIHEFGYSGPEDVRSFVRMQVQAWGRPMNPPREVTVRPFTRQMNMPARPYMRPALAEKKQAIVERFRIAIQEALAA